MSAPAIVSLPSWIVLNSKGAKWGLRAIVKVPLFFTLSNVLVDEEQAAKDVKAKIPARPNKSFFHGFIINLFSIFINYVSIIMYYYTFVNAKIDFY